MHHAVLHRCTSGTNQSTRTHVGGTTIHVSRVGLLLPVLLFLNYSLLGLEYCSAQVHITETVQIQPKAISPASSRTQSLSSSESIATLTFSYFWRGSGKPTIEFWGPCGFYQSLSGVGKGVDGTSIQIFVSPAPEGTYTYKITPPYAPDFCGEAFTITDDQGHILRYDGSGPYACQMDSREGGAGLFYYSDFTAMFSYDTLTAGQVQRFGIQQVTDTSGIRWNPPNYTRTMTIIAGADCGQFYDDAYHPVGLRVTDDSVNIEGVKYIPTGIPEPGETVQILVTYGDKSHIISFFVKGQPPYFDGTMEIVIPDTIEAGNAIPFSLKAFDDQGREFSPPPNDGAWIEILDHPEWAMFLGNDSLGYVDPEFVSTTVDAISQKAFSLLGRADIGYTPSEYESVDLDFYEWGDYYWVEGEKQVVIHFAPPGCTVVSLDPPFMSAGDTASIVIQSKDDKGVLSSYPPGQLFDIVIKSGSEFGKLLCVATGEIGVAFDAHPGPFRFIASSDTSSDTVAVEIEAYPSVVTPIMIATKQPGGNIHPKISASVSRQATLDAIGKNFAIAQTTGEGSGCGLTPPIVTFMIGPKKSPTPRLIVLSPLDNAKTVEKITAEPEMPPLSVKAQLVNYSGNVNYYVTITKLKWTAPVSGRITTGFFQGSASGTGVVDIPFQLTPTDYMRGGDDVEIDIRAVANEQIYTIAAPLKNPYVIEGLNPERATVISEISDNAPQKVRNYDNCDTRILLLITWQESSFRQFQGSPGFPLQGTNDKNDFGVMQVHNPPNDDIIWNWKKNIEGGFDKYNEKKKTVADYVADINEGRAYPPRQPSPKDWYADPNDRTTQLKFNPSPLTEEQRITELFQRYNGGVYWRWVPTDSKEPLGDGNWVAQPTKKDTETGIYGEYGKILIGYYNGNVPWN